MEIEKNGKRIVVNDAARDHCTWGCPYFIYDRCKLYGYVHLYYSLRIKECIDFFGFGGQF